MRVSSDDKRKGSQKEARRPPEIVIAMVVLSMLLAASSLIALNRGVANYYQTQLENQYRRSSRPYETTNNLEIKLSAAVSDPNRRFRKTSTR